ncbi:MAG: DctP family TRAP transporter solute-binding subunit [Oscillibacter sp.]|jgi:C4-dicarboxylate transporter DctM subunit|nr:DctP family TRAP transporter solute-binding subunit [Oscillibacter sp.]
MKRLAAWLLSAALCTALLTGCGGSGAQSAASGSGAIEIEAQTWKLTYSADKDSTGARAAEKFAQLIAERTNGAIQVECHPADELTGGDTEKGIHAVMDGQISLSLYSSPEYTKLDPRFGVVSLPFLFDSAEDADAKLEGKGGDALRSVLEEYGLRCMGIGENGFRLPTNSRRAITSPEDLQGLKIRTADSDVLQHAYQYWGAETTSAAWPMVYTALQTGKLDGQENPLTIADAASIQQTQKYVTKWNASYDCLFLCMNQKLYDSLSPEVQKIADQCGAEAAEYQRGINRESEEEILKKWSGQMTVTELTEESAQAFKKAAEPCWNEFRNNVSPELLETFENA